MSILIKNVLAVDGTGREPYPADVLIQKNLISAIGNLKNKAADETIEGNGDYLAPGFIDLDTSSDHYLALFTNPSQSDFVNQGITTAIGGHCGSSLAPLLYGSLESVRKWADVNTINVNWHTLAEFLKTLSRVGLGVNFGTLVGHSTIRRAILGDETRDLTKNELQIFKELLVRAMDEGAFGLSTGFGYVHGRNVAHNEVRNLLKFVSERDGLYSTHLRSETADLLPAIDEALRAGRETGVKTLVNHFRPILGFEHDFNEALSRIENANLKDFYFYAYPSDKSLTAIYTLLPDWAKEKNLETMLENIRKAVTAEMIERDISKLDYSKITVAEAHKNEHLIGKTIPEVAEIFELPPAKALLKLMKLTGMRATVFHQNINSERLKQILTHPLCLIASNSAARTPNGKFIPNDRSVNTFPRYLELTVLSGKLPIEKAIEKITSVPARLLNLKDRGVVSERKIADLTLLDKNNLKPRLTIVNGAYQKGIILKHTANEAYLPR